jgi:hypothetical protein
MVSGNLRDGGVGDRLAVLRPLGECLFTILHCIPLSLRSAALRCASKGRYGRYGPHPTKLTTTPRPIRKTLLSISRPRFLQERRSIRTLHSLPLPLPLQLHRCRNNGPAPRHPRSISRRDPQERHSSCYPRGRSVSGCVFCAATSY